MSDKDVDMSDKDVKCYVNLSDKAVDMSDKDVRCYINLSDKDVDMSDKDVDLSDNFVAICMALTGQDNFLRINFLTNE